MKRLYAGLHLWMGCLCALMVCTLPLAQARGLSDIQQQRRIVVATEGQFPPFNSVKNGQLTGFEIDLMELIAKKLGLTIEWKTADFDALLPGLGQNKWDLVIASHAITKERSAIVDFAQTHYCSGGVVVTKNPLLRSARELEGKTVSVQAGTSYFDNLKKLSGLKEIKSFPQDSEARNAMFGDMVDAWITDRFAAADALRATPSSKARSQVLLFPEHIAAAVAKDNLGLKDAYNKTLDALYADGSYSQLAKRYFGDMDLRCTSTP